MKKPTVCILIFLFVLLVSGCSGAAAPEKVDTHIDTHFTASYRGLELQGVLIFSEDLQMCLEISTPDELSGLSFSWGDDFTIGYRGLNAVTETDYLPHTAFAQAIKNTMDDIAIADISLQKDENGLYFYKGKTDSGCYVVYTDNQGKIKEISLPPLELNMKL